MSFLETENFQKRTDHSFKFKLQPEHRQGTTLLLNIPHFDIIDNVPVDYSHCALLNGMKKLLCNTRYGWIYGKPPYKLPARDVSKISTYLEDLKKHIPCEFARKPRSIVECKRYKMTEFRLFLLYTGPVVLKEVLPSKMYNNFMTFSLATSILISPYHSSRDNYISYAHDLFKHFIKISEKLYGSSFISHSIHNLLHLSDCVRLFGPLDNFSAFEFKNYLQTLKKKIRKSSSPLQQVIRRIVEERNILEPVRNSSHTFPHYSIEHNNGPLLKNCTSPQYKKMTTAKYSIDISRVADRFVQLRDEKIVEVKNFCHHENVTILLGYEYDRCQDFYTKPCSSTLFDIFYIQKSNNSLRVWNIDTISRKSVVLVHKGHYVSFPMLHNM